MREGTRDISRTRVSGVWAVCGSDRACNMRRMPPVCSLVQGKSTAAGKHEERPTGCEGEGKAASR